MLPPARSNAGTRCIHCAIRTLRLDLQLSRSRLPLRSYHASVRSHERQQRDRGGHKLFRFTGGGKRSEGYQAKTDKGGVIRKHFGPVDNGRAKGFGEALGEKLKSVKKDLQDAPIIETLQREMAQDGGKPESFGKIWTRFTKQLTSADNGLGGKLPFFGETKESKAREQVMDDLRTAYARRGEAGLTQRLKYAFYGHVTGARFTDADLRNQKALADLRFPTEWYPATRQMSRTIHLHVGPTNSGKTYHALQRLEQAGRGVYAGPLRLLAHEVFTRMTAKGKTCALVTGEERRVPEDEEGQQYAMMSCTVEMMPLNKSLDVAVIDEIQMIGNAERGWAWTQALLGVMAKEVHLCGEERTVPLIRELCASIGEKLEIHRYERLSPLKMADQSLNGKLNDLRKGDCIVSFSVMGIHALRRQIEKATGRKVATVYGSLPPETRAQQARLFNDPNNDYDFLVASDAVGMGLNLAIKRIIFEASNKFDGIQRRTLSVADIKQIAGRAGRYRTAAQATDALGADLPPPASSEQETLGLVTTLEDFDFPVVKAAMESDPEPIKSAGIFPPAAVLERFSSYFPPGTPFSYIVTRLHELSMMHKRFHLCGLKDQVWIADLIEPVRGLTVSDRNTICSSPASKSDTELWKDLMPAYARIIASQEDVQLCDIPELPLEVLEAEVSPSREYLRELERLHKGLVSYLWLSYRFAGIFRTRALAFHVKAMVEEKIEDVLGKFSFSEAQRRKIAAKRERQLLERGEEAVAQDAATGEDVRVPTQQTSADSLAEEINTLDEQTILSSGGDRFGGEEDISFEEPEIAAEVLPEQSESFAEWRARQTKGESQGSVEDENAGSIVEAKAEAQEAGRESLRQRAEKEPTLEDVQERTGDVDWEKMEMDLGFGGMPETELEERPVKTQEAGPRSDR